MLANALGILGFLFAQVCPSVTQGISMPKRDTGHKASRPMSRQPHNDNTPRFVAFRIQVASWPPPSTWSCTRSAQYVSDPHPHSSSEFVVSETVRETSSFPESIIVDCLHGLSRLRSPGCVLRSADRDHSNHSLAWRARACRGRPRAATPPRPHRMLPRLRRRRPPGATHPCESRRCGALERLLPLGDSAI